MTQLLKLFHEMCKYKLDPANIVEDTDQIWFCPWTERHTAGQGKITYCMINILNINWNALYGSKVNISLIVLLNRVYYMTRVLSTAAWMLGSLVICVGQYT